MVPHAQSGHESDLLEPDLSLLLTDAIEGLYSIFRQYPLKSRIDGCPCCVGEEDQARIHSRSLRALTDEDLEGYAWSALFTWGDVDDFRHFLPRLLELLTGHPDDVLTEVLLARLTYADWSDWPERERIAIESVLRLRWAVGLGLDPEEFSADAWLCGVALAGVEISDYVGAWKTSAAPTAFAHIVEFLESNPDLLTEGTLRNAFYEGGPTETAVSDAMREWLSTCMADPEFQARLAAWYQGAR